jgi:(1->4)-alpha-D-glucan 1-alpha-D-glucosylmutase
VSPDLRATYRVQLHAGFRFADAAAIADYLAELGISHLYSSPYLQAAPGSTHGYDVVNYNKVNEELGGAEGHARLCAALDAAGMGQVLDIVPNHMAIVGRENPWWWDVLENGQSTPYASYFDVEWDPPESKLRDMMLLPVLGDHYGRVLDNGEFALQRAQRELGYRRFFDINTLVGLRAEDERVFADTDALILEWLLNGVLDGVRVDHPDGLRDPQLYFDRLHAVCPGAWIVAEKILQPGERLPETWPVAGTTGYDFIYRVNNLFVDPAAEAALSDFYAEFTGGPTDFSAIVHQKKHLVLSEILGSDLNRLTALFVDVCERHRRHRDYTRHELHEALREVIARFPVYRTYVCAEAGVVRDDDARIIQQSIDAAKNNRPDLDSDLFDFFRDILLLKVRGEPETELIMRFQQLTGPVLAKGLEDTAFYCFNRLVSLNEVGVDPGRIGVSMAEFHAACAEAQARRPRAMLASSTDDTKRSEDVRARINLLSELPERWSQTVQRWAELNQRYRRQNLPDRNTECLLYQTLVGAWPIDTERAIAYMEKASREAKAHTSWTDPNPVYEDALRAFVEGVLNSTDFTRDLENFVTPLIEPGRINSLAQTLVKLTAPGIPDFYQGTELWELSLVDPDNRRPVDYGRRRRLLGEMKTMTPEQIWDRIDDGLPKLWVIRQALKLRHGRQFFVPEDSYRSMAARGAKSDHVVAFARGERAITVVPRLSLKLAGHWGDTAIEIPPGRWRNELTDETIKDGEIRMAALFKRFPVALLSREGESS